MKTNGLRVAFLQKLMNTFHWGPIFYVCSFASNRVPFMYNYYIRNSLWAAAILDI